MLHYQAWSSEQLMLINYHICLRCSEDTMQPLTVRAWKMRRCNRRKTLNTYSALAWKYWWKNLVRKSIIIGLIVVLIIAIAGGYFAWAYYSKSNPPAVQVRNITMTYIKANHNQTAQYMQNFSWTGGKITPMGVLGAEWYSYQSDGWNVTIQYPVALPPGSITTYTVTATYASQIAPQEAIVSWQGTIQNGIVTQTSYKYNP